MHDVRPASRQAGRTSLSTPQPIAPDGKYLRAGCERFLVKGVTYGTFAPSRDGCQFPLHRQVADDFQAMAALGINTVRTYTAPPEWLLEEAARHDLRLMIGLPWSQHIAFLDDRHLRSSIRRDIAAQVRRLGTSAAAMLFALGNEIPAAVVRWHGAAKVEDYLGTLYEEAKAASPGSLFTYANFPPTEYLDLPQYEVCSFNVYLHREPDLRAYLGRLQHIAGNRPLLLSEAGADSLREGLDAQAAITAAHMRVAFEEGACGAVAFAWTDEWWRGGHTVDDWCFGLVDAQRRPKPAARAVAGAFADAPFQAADRAQWPRVSVVVCAYNAADTIDDCLQSLSALEYLSYEVIVVNDGSRDGTGTAAARYAGVRVIDIPNGGLSAARNVGLAAATGDIVAYTDADVRVDPWWLDHLVQPFLRTDVVGAGGPNVVPADDPPVAQCVARAPGGPTHVLLDDRIAEHVPGCNMAFRREALLAIGGFDPIYLRAGDDVDVCWRLQARGGKIGFAAAALVWHHHRTSIRAYWRQQVGYGEGETWLMAHHPEKFVDGRARWQGRIYSPLPFMRSLTGRRINAGVWGTAPFPSVYECHDRWWALIPHGVTWQLIALTLIVAALASSQALGTGAASAMAAAGVAMLAATAGRTLVYARRSNLAGVPAAASVPWRSRVWYRGTIAYLHWLQPLARAYGRVRGWWSLDETVPQKARVDRVEDAPPALRHLLLGLRLAVGEAPAARFWSESWISAEQVLRTLRDNLDRHRAVRLVAVDEGWWSDRDLSVLCGRLAWMDVRVLVEEHAGGRCLLRVQRRLRPAHVGWAVLGALAFAVFGGLVFGTGDVQATLAGTVALTGAGFLWGAARASAAVDAALTRVMTGGLLPLDAPGFPRVRAAWARLRSVS